MFNPACPDPSQLKVAVLPMVVEGNPDKKQESGLSDKFSIKLMELGFQVIDRSIVESQLTEMKIDYSKPLTPTQMKELAKVLSVDALFISVLSHRFQPGYSQSKGRGYLDNSYGAVSSNSYSTGGAYVPISESVKLINPNTNITYITAYAPQSNSYSMSDEIIKSMERKIKKFYKK